MAALTRAAGFLVLLLLAVPTGATAAPADMTREETIDVPVHDGTPGDGGRGGSADGAGLEDGSGGCGCSVPGGGSAAGRRVFGAASLLACRRRVRKTG